MDQKTQVAVNEIARNNIREVLKKYFTKDLVNKITNEIMPGIEWDLGNMEEG